MAASFGEALLMASFAGVMQIGVFLVVPFAIVWAAWKFPLMMLPLICLYAKSYFDGAEKSTSRSRAWPRFSRNFWLLRFMREYFPQRVHVPKDFPALRDGPNAKGDRQQYLFAVHPHGSMSEFRLLMDGQFLDLLPGLGGKQVCWLAASVLFRLPVAREMCLWSGCVDAGRSTAERMLKAGHSVGVIPGGEHEQLLTTRGKEIIYIKKRFGFVKLALRFGVPLVPCYVFGSSDLYYTSKFLLGFRLSLVKALGIAVPFCVGAYGIPGAPLKEPLNIVLGQPLHFDRCDNPTDEQVSEAHARYIKALQDVFDENKKKFGYDERNLILQ